MLLFEKQQKKKTLSKNNKPASEFWDEFWLKI